MTIEEQIYGFERVFESSLKVVFEAAGVKAFTSQDAPDFQKERPRVDVVFVPGAGKRQVFFPQDGTERETAWAGKYMLSLITEPDAATHNAFRTKVRSVMHGLREAINGVEPMTLHKLQYLTDAGTSSVYKSEEGNYQSAMTFDIDFSIQKNAWDLLTPN